MKRRLSGFTLVELLVVITIIGMLVGLLLPAVNMAREAGRRATCSNNLHQLALAFKSHSEKLNVFPSGGWGSNWVGTPNNGSGANQPGGWLYQLLPYMDQETLHEAGKSGVTSVSNSGSYTRVSIALPALYCASRRAGVPYPFGTSSPSGANPQSPLLTNTVSQGGRSDYAVNGGTVYISHGQGPSSTTAGASNTWPNLTALGFTGLVSVHSSITEAMVTDSKQTTYLIGEKYLSPENYTTGIASNPADAGDLLSDMSGDDICLIRWANTTLLPSMDRVSTNPTNPPPPNPSKIFGSAHSAGYNMSFLDGHVQLLNYAIDPTTHQGMATRAGHEVIDPSLL